MDLHGRVALVTGASRGIGAASAIALGRRGMRVALVGLEPSLLRATAQRCGPLASWHEADVADAAGLRAAVDAVLAAYGHLDVVFANAGIAVHGPLHRLAPADVARLLDVNLLGAAHTAWATTDALVASRGYLLFNASLAAVVGPPALAPYAASKAGVDALAGALRAELRPSGVAVGVASFGFVDTDMAAAAPARVKLPVSAAADAVVRAIEGRRARVVAPRWLAPAVPMRGLVRPLAERAFGARRPRRGRR
jgi:NAD(P)-dependent dehydrogenase (short-subunit alcohol dehydrogenase family)